MEEGEGRGLEFGEAAYGGVEFLRWNDGISRALLDGEDCFPGLEHCISCCRWWSSCFRHWVWCLELVIVVGVGLLTAPWLLRDYLANDDLQNSLGVRKLQDI